ncbi:MAG: hypothetical protein Q7W55_01625 [Pseudohongiella sp.]|nr:hypothetical protein [Pseudohongiella sp.]MDO9520398.1 hypothetical protein [Pseudohongiella sp.]MDP2126593.1 hypothetical protein [Pseudohongiella sp.]
MTEQQKNQEPGREYEKSGLYPDNNEKPFRIFALLGWIVGIVVVLAVTAAVLDLTLIER